MRSDARGMGHSLLVWATAWFISASSGEAQQASVRYVAAGNDQAQAPYATWATAAATIQDAVDAAEDGDIVLVNDGVYSAGSARSDGVEGLSRIVVDKAITVRSVNGPLVTIIEGRGDEADAPVRCAYLKNSTLSGFTLTGGCASQGGGVFCDLGAVVSACFITGNSAGSGGGVCGKITQNDGSEPASGAVLDCTISQNLADQGGACDTIGLVSNCLITANTTAQGEAVHAVGELIDNVISDNDEAGEPRIDASVPLVVVSGERPNFTVTSLATTPSVMTRGCAFTATVTVTNNGTVAGDAGILRLWLNKPVNAVAEETGNVQRAVGELAAGAGRVLTFEGLTATNANGTFTLRAFVDANNLTAETSNGDNQKTLTYSFGQEYENRPNFTITSFVTTPSVLTRGGAFTATVTVTNNGLAAGNAGVLRLWLNKPLNAKAGEAGDAQKTVGELAAGAGRVLVFEGLTATNANGTFTLRAFVDANNLTVETSNGDNQRALTYSFGPAYENRPNFTITSFVTTPSVMTKGGAFTATVTVTNNGLAAGNAGVLQLWLNKALNASAGEAGDAQKTVGELAAGAGRVLVFEGLTAANSNGTFTLRAFVDANNLTAETSNGDNQRTRTYSFGPAYEEKPNFTVTSLMTTPSVLTKGGAFMVTVTVTNNGLAAGNAGVLRLWLNKPLNASVGEAGNAQQTVGELAAGAGRVLVFEGLTATNANGTFTLRAFVDANNLTAETSNGDNQRTRTYSFGSAYEEKPNFTVTSLTTTPSVLTKGGAFTATVTVFNNGAASGNAGVLRLWLNKSVNAYAGEAGDAQQTVGELAPGAGRVLVFEGLTATNANGTFTLRAFVDANNLTAETSNGDNQRTRTYSFVSAYEEKPNFTVTSLMTTPSVLTKGGAFMATVAVTNNGLAAGNAGVLRLWLNKSANAYAGEAGDAQQTVGELAPGAGRVLTFEGLTATNANGTFTLRAFVDANNLTAETSNGDNQRAKTYSFGPSYEEKPNFTVTLITTTPSTLAKGGAFTARVAVTNNGLAAGNAGVLRLWLNKSVNAYAGEAGDAQQTVGELAPGAGRVLTFEGLTATNANGTFTLRAFVDANNLTAETSNGDNQRALTYTFSSGYEEKPNFTVTSFVTTPSDLTKGCAFTARVAVTNNGRAAGNAGVLRLWLNKAVNANAGEAGDAQQTVGELAPGAGRVLTFEGLTATNANGTFTLRAFVDANNLTAETSNGDNQMALTYSFGAAYEDRPNFTITSLMTTPAVLTRGGAFTMAVTVTNNGTVAGNAGVLRLWLNKSANANAGEAGDAQQTVGELAAGAGRVLVFEGLTATNASGTFTLRAFVDADNLTAEKSNGDNQRVLTYSFGSFFEEKPDFMVTALSTTPSVLTKGGAFTTTVTVTNYATVGGDAGILRFWLHKPVNANAGEAGDAQQTVGELAAGAGRVLVFEGLTATNAVGTFTLRAYVDANNLTSEKSDGNNQVSRSYSFQ